MKKGTRIFLIIFVILLIAILADTAQARILNNRPIIKTTENYNNGNVLKKDKGIFVYTYIFNDGKKKTFFKWEKYAPNLEKTPKDLETNNNNEYNQTTNEQKEYSFFGKVIESNTNNIIVEPNENEEIRKSEDKIYIELEENNDAIYKVGTNVKITYNGEIIDSYPAKVKATNIEIKSVNQFNLVFYQKTMIKPKQKETIISKGEMENIDYNVYSFEGNIAINLNSNSLELTESSISLREALLQKKITMEEIIEKANKDLKEKNITGDMYKDGGSMIYKYNNYTIIKCHTVNGNRDVYIGSKDMKISDLSK